MILDQWAEDITQVLELGEGFYRADGFKFLSKHSRGFEGNVPIPDAVVAAVEALDIDPGANLWAGMQQAVVKLDQVFLKFPTAHNGGLSALVASHRASEASAHGLVVPMSRLLFTQEGLPIQIQERLHRLTNCPTKEQLGQMLWLRKEDRAYTQVGLRRDGKWACYDLDDAARAYFETEEEWREWAGPHGELICGK